MFWRHLFGYVPVNLANGLMGFASVYFFTRLLGAEDYGRYALILTLLNLLHTMALTWCEAAAYRFTGRAEAQGNLASHYRTALALGIGSFGPALLLVGGVYLALREAPDLQVLIPWLFLLLPLNVLTNIALETHKASRRVGRYSLIETSRILGGFLAGVLLAWLGGYGAAAPFMGLAIAWVIAGLHEGVWLFRKGRDGVVTVPEIRRHIAYGLPIAAALSLDLLLSASDRFLIAYFIDNAAVGAYAAGYGVADKTVLMICAWGAMAGSPLLMAAFESGDKTAIHEASRRFFGTLFLLSAPAAVGLALVAEPLAQFMIAEELRAQATLIIPWIAAAGFFNGLLIYFFTEAFQLTQRTGLRALLMLIPAVLNIALNVILLPQIGLMGAVYATVGCYALGVLILGSVGRRLLRLPLPLRDITVVALSCAAMALAVTATPTLFGFVGLLLKGSVGALVYTVCVVALDGAGARRLFSDGIARVRALRSSRAT